MVQRFSVVPAPSKLVCRERILTDDADLTLRILIDKAVHAIPMLTLSFLDCGNLAVPTRDEHNGASQSRLASPAAAG